MKTKEEKQLTAIGPVTNDASDSIRATLPYIVFAKIQGNTPLLFHRWSCEDVASKAAAKKGSKEKKTDNIESFLYRNQDGLICLPSEYLRMAIVHAAKFIQDPRSPRKSGADLFKAAISTVEELHIINNGVLKPDYLDQRKVTIQRNGITRIRPAFQKGWTCEVLLQVNLPEYVSQELLLEVLSNAGRFIGLADFRPTYGRFQVTGFGQLDLAA